MFLVLDFETRSEADLKKVGAFEYSKHPSTEIICAAWKLGTKKDLLTAKVKSWSPAIPSQNAELIRALGDPDIKIIAHNAFFEQCIIRHCLTKMVDITQVPIARFGCTASLAASHALPRNLEGACQALGLPVQKDMEGRRLVLKYCKPRRATKNNQDKWHSNLDDIKRLMKYCETDVEAETHLFLKLPPLCKTERAVWELDQKINFRGFKVDRPLIDKTLEMIETETRTLNDEISTLTDGQINSATQRDKILAHLGYMAPPDLTAKTVENALKSGSLDPKITRILEIRQATSKTSTAKYQAMRMRADARDARVRDILVYHTASTGRWGGAGVQPQNFPRGNIKEIQTALKYVIAGDLDFIRLIFGEPMNVFSSALRSMIIPESGKEFFCADYAAIEARVLFWVAENEPGLNAFRDGRDLYKELAAVIFNRSVNEVTKDQRFVGKTSILGAGYGMGPKKFQATCEAQGTLISEETAKSAIETYRKVNFQVVDLWDKFSRVSIAAVEEPGKMFSIKKTKWWVENDFLYCELPSKRRIAYYKPTIKHELTPWKEKRPVLYHYGVNGLTRKWEESSTYGGKLTENVVQAIARDLMAEAMLRIEKAGYEIVLTVHDELLAERKKGIGDIKEFCDLMSEVPLWAKGCPVNVEGWQGDRYKK